MTEHNVLGPLVTLMVCAASRHSAMNYVRYCCVFLILQDYNIKEIKLEFTLGQWVALKSDSELLEVTQFRCHSRDWKEDLKDKL